ncbi:MAG: hypothetical protein ACJAWL_001494 [Motiliproteus sp.]|jgi:uncharacterized protein (TIGR04255 family)
MAYQPIGQLSKAPLVYVVGMVQTQPLANLLRYIPQIQDTLRKLYPDYKQQSLQDVQIHVSPEGVTQSENTANIRYVFTSVDKKWGVAIQSNRIFLHTTAYAGFEDFSKRLLEFLDIYSEIVALDYYQGIGIRYIDLISPTDEHQVSDILQDRFLPLALDDFKTDAPTQGRLEFYNPTEHGALIMRSHIMANQMTVPQDLLDLYTPLGEPQQVTNSVILDTDHCTQSNALIPFDSVTVVAIMDELHKAASHAFRKAVAPQALEDWR